MKGQNLQPTKQIDSLDRGPLVKYAIQKLLYRVRCVIRLAVLLPPLSGVRVDHFGFFSDEV